MCFPLYAWRSTAVLHHRFPTKPIQGLYVPVRYVRLHFRDETCGDAKTPDITYGDLSYGDETYGYVTYRDVSSLYRPSQGVGQKETNIGQKISDPTIGP